MVEWLSKGEVVGDFYSGCLLSASCTPFCKLLNNFLFPWSGGYEVYVYLNHESSLGVLGGAGTPNPSGFGQPIPGVGRAQRVSSAPAGCSWGKREAWSQGVLSVPGCAECPSS